MKTVRFAPMGSLNSLRIAVVVCALTGAAVAQNATSSPVAASFPQAPDNQTAGSSPDSSSNKKTSHEKTVQNSGGSSRHLRVAEDSEPMPELTQAEVQIQKKDNAAAEALLLKAVGRDPANYEAWFDLGFVENALGKVDHSIAAYRKSVAAKPDVFESNLNLGLQLAKTEQPDAPQFLRAATQLKPTSHVAEGQYRAWLSLGHVLEKSNLDEALAAYRKAAELQTNEPEPHVAAGHLLETQQQYADAEQEYKKALGLDPKSDALTGLANILLHTGRFADAEEYLRKLTQLHPEEAAAHLELGRVLAAQGKNDDAIAELQSCLKLTPQDDGAQRDLAETYVAAGQTDEAQASFRLLVAAHPQDANLHWKLGQTLLHQKNFAEAQQQFFAAVKLKPDFAEAYGDLAFAASENKDYGLTLKALDARAKFVADVPTTYFLRASALDHLKDFKQAAANYHLFLKTDGGKYPDQEWQAKHRLVAIEPKK